MGFRWHEHVHAVDARVISIHSTGVCAQVQSYVLSTSGLLVLHFLTFSYFVVAVSSSNLHANFQAVDVAWDAVCHDTPCLTDMLTDVRAASMRACAHVVLDV